MLMLELSQHAIFSAPDRFGRGLMSSLAGATVQSPLLVVIIFLLLYQLFRKRDSYVVEHCLYDLNFI
jgi:hypothetical protein